MNNVGSQSSGSSDGRKFRLGIISLMIALLPLGLAVSLGLASSASMSTQIGRWFGAVVVSLLLGWIGFHVCRRSNVIGNVLFCLVMVLTMAAPHLNTARNQSAMEQLRDQNVASLDELEKQLLSSDTTQPVLANWDRQIKAALDTARRSSGSQAEALKASAQVMVNLRSTVSEYQEAADRLSSANILDAGTIGKREDLASRLAVISKFREANARFQEGLKDFPAAVASRIQSVSVDRRRAVADDIAAAMSLALIAKIREEDAAFSDHSSAMLTILDKEWGKWKYEGDPPDLVFDDDDTMNKYNEQLARLQAAAERQEDHQKQLISQMRARLTKP